MSLRSARRRFVSARLSGLTVILRVVVKVVVVVIFAFIVLFAVALRSGGLRSGDLAYL